MVSPRTAKFINIKTGDHAVSPHVTSLKNSSVDAETHKTALPKPAPEQPVQPLTINFSIPRATVQEKINARVQELENKTEKFETEIKTKAKKLCAKIKLPSLPKTKKASVVFVLLAFLITVPLKAITTYEDLRAAAGDVADIQNTNFGHTTEAIATALGKFRDANESLGHISALEEFILRHTPFFGKKFGAGSRLVAAGQHTSLAAASYMQLFKVLETKKDAPLIERLQIFFEGNRAVLSELSAAAELVKPIDPSALSENERALVTDTRAAILALHNDAKYLADAGPVLLQALGTTAPRRYLIIFQNPTELRPTGGFIGSFALVDVENGEIKKLEIPAGGSYDLSGALKKIVRSPLPMHIINPQWQFQDGNWFPDFPTSAQKLMWFLEKSQGPTVDGVIAVNADLLPELLAVIGSVKNSATGTELTAATALNDIRASIEKSKTTKTPKEIITNAAPQIFDALKTSSASQLIPIMNVLINGLEQRDVQLYVSDSELQKNIVEFGWDGSIKQNPGGDYLMVVNTNIGGQKTDAVINQKIDHQASIGPDGTVTITVHLGRTQKKSSAALEGGPNIDYVRLYVPKGATLLAAQGFVSPPEAMFKAAETWQKSDSDLSTIEKEVGINENSGTRITEEFGHTVFGNWLITSPGTSSEAVVTYTLPEKIGLTKRVVSYTTLLQRQSGTKNTDITSRVLLPDNARLTWINNPGAQVADNGALVSSNFENDLFYAITFYAPHS